MQLPLFKHETRQSYSNDGSTESFRLRKDEPVLIKRVNNHLAKHRQTATQTKDRKMFDGYRPS